MLKGTRTAIIKRIQPVSIHGQISLDVFFVDPEDPEEEVRHARVGGESVPRGHRGRRQGHHALRHGHGDRDYEGLIRHEAGRPSASLDPY